MTGGEVAVAGPELQRRADDAARALRAVGGGAVVDRAEAYCGLLRALPVATPYNRMTPEVIAACNRFKADGGTSLLAAVHRFAILRLAPAAREALQARPWLGAVRPWFEDALAGIARDLESVPDGELDFHADPFRKDLSVVLLRLWPLGAVCVDPRVPMSRRWFIEDGLRSLVLGAGLLARLGGATAPMYELHAYHRHMSEFTEEGWTACYRRIAGIMAVEPEVRAVLGKTWFWDPQLEQVSPRLTYLRRLPLANGAVFLKTRNGPHTRVNALQKSETRRRLHAAGRYEPQEYVMVWPRRDFLRWAGLQLE